MLKTAQLVKGTPIADAALNGHLEVVIYLRQLELPWNEQTCRNAAMKGHLDLLKWCRANKCPWDAETCANAASNGHLVLLGPERINVNGINGQAPMLRSMVTLRCSVSALLKFAVITEFK